MPLEWSRHVALTGRPAPSSSVIGTDVLCRDFFGRWSFSCRPLSFILFRPRLFSRLSHPASLEENGPQPPRVGRSTSCPDNLTRAEARERFALIKTHAYQVEIDLTGRGGRSTGRGSIHIDGAFSSCSAAVVHIDLIADSVISATWMGPSWIREPSRTRLPFSVTPGEHVLSVAATLL